MAKDACDWDSAQKYFERAVNLNADQEQIHNNLGITLQTLGKLEEAEKSFRHAIFLRSDFSEAHSNLGTVLLRQGKHREGLDELALGGGVINLDLNNGLSMQWAT